MGITFRDGEDGYPWAFQVEAAEPCFYCGHRLAYPIIGWMGRSTDIVLHHHCALALCVRLIRDVHEVECKIGDLRNSYRSAVAQPAKHKPGGN